MLAAIELLIEAVDRRTQIEPLSLPGGVQLSLSDYPVDAVRELVVNALIHRSYDTHGTVDIEHTADQLTISSPGGFVAGVTPQNILTCPSTPRNRLLTETVALLQLAERTGQGVDRAYREMLRSGKEPPAFRSADVLVQAALQGGTGNKASCATSPTSPTLLDGTSMFSSLCPPSGRGGPSMRCYWLSSFSGPQPKPNEFCSACPTSGSPNQRGEPPTTPSRPTVFALRRSPGWRERSVTTVANSMEPTRRFWIASASTAMSRTARFRGCSTSTSTAPATSSPTCVPVGLSRRSATHAAARVFATVRPNLLTNEDEPPAPPAWARSWALRKIRVRTG